MLCENCGNHEANVRYTQIVNGVKKEMILCENCAKQLGIEEFHFNMPMDLPSFLGEFMEEYNDTNFLPSFATVKELKCDNCGMTYNAFVNTGKLGCLHCYDVFADRINPILKNLHGSSNHVGRKGKITESKMNHKIEAKKEKEKEPKEDMKLKKLKEELKKAIKEERYEEAAKLRDEINQIEKK